MEEVEKRIDGDDSVHVLGKIEQVSSSSSDDLLGSVSRLHMLFIIYMCGLASREEIHPQNVLGEEISPEDFYL